MACFKPIQAYWLLNGKTSKGAKIIVFNEPRSGEVFSKMQIPCGQCIGCRLERARVWGIRIMHEASLYKDNCFLTLTYNNEFLPLDNSLVKADITKFIKRLRSKFYDTRIRYFLCGEYGENFNRPHYHCIIFNFIPDDLQYFKKTKAGSKIYASETLSSLWKFGFITVGEVNFNSAVYCAKYSLKKINGEDSDLKYLDERTGSIKTKEFIQMSLKPGIGYDFYEKYKYDIYRNDEIIVNGSVSRPFRFYDNKLFNEDRFLFDKIKIKRIDKAKKFIFNNTQERLLVREKLMILKNNLFKRSIQ